MDVIIGFITELTGEKRGPSKHYRRYNILTRDNELINGWIFATTTIDETYSGKILVTASENNSAVRIEGKISTDAGNKKLII
jgi:hypothetical protein